MKAFLDILFSKLKWYRKATGGIWFLIQPTAFPELEVWLRNPNENYEKIVGIDYYLYGETKKINN